MYFPDLIFYHAIHYTYYIYAHPPYSNWYYIIYIYTYIRTKNWETWKYEVNLQDGAPKYEVSCLISGFMVDITN